MFGYIVCAKQELSKEEQVRYQSFYCGICRALKEKYGQLARFSLNYDLTFLALFLSALYEPEETGKEIRCAIHPTKKRTQTDNKFVEYAADMTILLTYYKCIDDWYDEKKTGKLRYANILKKHLKEIERKYPRQYETVKNKSEEIAMLEKSRNNMSDEIVNCSGDLLSELFVYDPDDYWRSGLRKFGYELGRFIYLMDAVIDYETDLKAGTFNPFIKMDFDHKRSKEILHVMIGNAMDQFERMPIVQDVGILKNILYGGVWTQYYAKTAGKDKKDDRRSL